MRSLILRRVSAAVLALCAACATSQSQPLDQFPIERTRDLTLHVENQNFYDATLYAVSDAQRLRLGIVGGHQDGDFTFRWRQLDLRIEIDLLSVGKYVTDELPVDEGDELELQIQPDLHRRIPRESGSTATLVHTS
jgi:outer membrane biogenesis lipoprotein LolB